MYSDACHGHSNRIRNSRLSHLSKRVPLRVVALTEIYNRCIAVLAVQRSFGSQSSRPSWIARLDAARAQSYPWSISAMNSFFDPSVPHTEEVTEFPNLTTEPIADYGQASLEDLGNGHGEEHPQSARRRRPSRPDNVKHKRTRNGCYTCRTRRVKVPSLSTLNDSKWSD